MSGQWSGDDEFKGEWYEGVIKSIDEVNEKIHIKYDDGDEDYELSWSKVMIL